MAHHRTRPELAVDAGVVVAAFLLGGTPLQLSASSFRSPFDLMMFVVLGATALALWFRRRSPEVVLWIVSAPVVLAAVGFAAIPSAVQSPSLDPDTGVLSAPVPFAVYAVTVYADRARRWVPVAFVAVVGVIAPNPLAALGQVVAMIGAPTALGLYAAARRRLLHALRERAERAERERELVAEQKIAEERARLAAEVHDVVTHRVSLMVLRAGALGLSTADPATRGAAEELRVAGCQALDELRDLMGVLHNRPRGTDPAAELEPVPSIADLVEASASVGVPVELIEEGEARMVSPAVGRTIYRIVQEALTNVRRHAPGASVELSLRYRPDGVQVIVRNEAPSSTPDGLPEGGRTGLLGLQRRVDLLHGTFRASATPSHGFAVEAELPLYVRSSL